VSGANADSRAGYGVAGSSASGKGAGVYGTNSANGAAVLGSTEFGIGVYGSGGLAGVIGYSPSADGVAASTISGIGLHTTAYGSFGIGLQAESPETAGVFIGDVVATNDSGDNPTVDATNSASSYGGRFTGGYGGIWGRTPSTGYPIVATDSSNNTVFDVDGQGDVSFAGNMYTLFAATDGALLKGYSTKTTAPTVEDTGSAQLVGGAAIVRLDPAFAKSIDPKTPYHVFITPNGDTHGVFVSNKTATNFSVRENQAGRSTVAFDYRVVATAAGQTGRRMAAANRTTDLPQFRASELAIPRAMPARRPTLPLVAP
jgi:hypothetical protein